VFFGIVPTLSSYVSTLELSVHAFTVLSLIATALSIWTSNWMGMAFTGIFPEAATDAAEYETEVWLMRTNTSQQENQSILLFPFQSINEQNHFSSCVYIILPYIAQK
jgi:hypothetical protein